MPLLTLAVTGSPAVAGTVAAAQALGGVIGFLPGGVLADRYDRRLLLAQAVANNQGRDAAVSLASGSHPADGEQRGVLLVGGVGEDGVVEASLFDTWHQQPGLMQLTGTRDGSRVDLSAPYMDEWAWEVSVELGDDVSMTMRNVVPESALAMLPPDSPPMSAGPYDAMVAVWR